MEPTTLVFDRVAICGRTLQEYEQFFGLGFQDWRGARILDCPGGTSSLVAERARYGLDVIAADPIYASPKEDLQAQARADIDHVVERVQAVPDLFTWQFCPTIEELRRRRETALEQFIGDYQPSPESARYVAASLPKLPFGGREFDLVLSGHLLFNYDDRLDYTFHRDSILELARVSRSEVRLFPVRGRARKPYAEMDRLLTELRAHGLAPEVRRIDYEFMRGWNEILIINKR